MSMNEQEEIQDELNQLRKELREARHKLRMAQSKRPLIPLSAVQEAQTELEKLENKQEWLWKRMKNFQNGHAHR